MDQAYDANTVPDGDVERDLASPVAQVLAKVGAYVKEIADGAATAGRQNKVAYTSDRGGQVVHGFRYWRREDSDPSQAAYAHPMDFGCSDGGLISLEWNSDEMMSRDIMTFRKPNGNVALAFSASVELLFIPDDIRDEVLERMVASSADDSEFYTPLAAVKGAEGWYCRVYVEAGELDDVKQRLAAINPEDAVIREAVTRAELNPIEPQTREAAMLQLSMSAAAGVVEVLPGVLSACAEQNDLPKPFDPHTSAA